MTRIDLWPGYVAGLLMSLSLGAGTATAQVPAQSETTQFRPLLAVGVAHIIGDVGETNSSTIGPALRAGMQLPGAQVALALTYWHDVNRFRLTSLQLEVVQDLTDAHRVTPNLSVAVGRTWSEYLGDLPTSDRSGTSAAFGLGLRVSMSDRLLVGGDARLRTDRGGWNGELRLMGEVASTRGLAEVGQGRASVVSSWMTPFSGPWSTAEPAWGMRVVRDGSVLVTYLVHWRIPREGGAGYTWDTRGVVAAVQADRAIMGDNLRLRAGPAIAAMGEGPDAGVNLGGLFEFAVGFHVSDVRIEGSAGLLWLRRSETRYPSDQRGAVWSLAIGV